MNPCTLALLTLALLCIFVQCRTYSNVLRSGAEYSNTFAVQIQGGMKAADETARKHHLRNRGKVGHAP